MVNDALDLTLLLQVPDRYPRQGAVDLQPLDEDGLADEAEGRDLLQDTVVGGLVEDDGVLRLVLDLALGPLLLLLLAAGCCGCLQNKCQSTVLSRKRAPVSWRPNIPCCRMGGMC